MNKEKSNIATVNKESDFNIKEHTTEINSKLLAEVNNNIVVIRGIPVISDADVANLYSVETKRINEAVRNNPDKFPSDYMFTLTSEELKDLRSKFSSTKISTKTRSATKVFTEKGLQFLKVGVH